MFRNDIFAEVDDNFDKKLKKMALVAIVGNTIIGIILTVGLIGFLYLIKIWFF